MQESTIALMNEDTVVKCSCNQTMVDWIKCQQLWLATLICLTLLLRMYCVYGIYEECCCQRGTQGVNVGSSICLTIEINTLLPNLNNVL